jgi:hypothetical protein
MNRDSGRVRIPGPASREPRRNSVAAMRHRSFAQEQIMPTGQKRKTGPLCSSQLHKGPALSYLAAILNGCKGRFISFGRGFALCPGCDPEAQSLSRGYDYFFFFEVFFATFLVAAFAVFFAFFAFLAMSSSLKNWLSEHAHAESTCTTLRRYHKCKIDTNAS